MSSPAIKIIKKVNIDDSLSDVKNEEQVIQINVSSDQEQMFSPVPIVGLNGGENNPHSSDNPMDVSVVQFEIGNSDATPTSSSNTESKSELAEENVFRIPPLLRVRQFSVQERLPISIDEIRRRISPPESLSHALILSLLRLNKERAKHLRKALALFGITDLPNRSAVVSSFSRLSEAEARGLAEDYYYLAARFMKVKKINHELESKNGEVFFASKARSTRLILEQILTEIEKRDSELNLLTHGFSPLILRAVFNILIEILTYNEQEKDLVFDAPNKITL